MKIEPNAPVIKSAVRTKEFESTATAQAEAAERSYRGKKTRTVRDVAFSIQNYTVQKGNRAEITIRDAQEGLLLLQTAHSQLRTMLRLLQQARDAAFHQQSAKPFLDELQRVAQSVHYKEIPLLDGSFTAVWIEVSAKRKLEFQTPLMNVVALSEGIKDEPASILASVAVLAPYVADLDTVIKKLAVYADIQKKNMLLTGNAEISAEQWDSLRFSMVASQLSAFYAEHIVPRLRNEKVSFLLIALLFLIIFIVVYLSAA